MSRRFVSFVAAVAGASLVIAGCAQAGPAPTPTKAPAAPTKAAEPTKAPAAAAPQPTAAPAKKVDWPQKGRAITLLVPFAAGGSNDIAARTVAPVMEKELGTPVQVVNRLGGGGQVGWTELATSRPDGYTIAAASLGSIVSTYMDAERKAAFGRKDLASLGGIMFDPNVFSVQAASPHKSLKDVVDAAKANPEKVKVAVGAVTGSHHLTALMLETLAGIRFALLNTDGGAQNITNLLGGHVDAAVNNSSEARQQFKAGAIRALALADLQESKFYPGVKTMESQGYRIVLGNNMGLIAPGATPKEIIDILTAALKKSLESDEQKKRFDDLSITPNYRTPAEHSALWDEQEKNIAPLLEIARKR